MIVFLDPGHRAAMADMGRQVPNGRGRHQDCQASGTSTDDGFAEHTFTGETTLKIRHRWRSTACAPRCHAATTPVRACVDARAQMANPFSPTPRCPSTRTAGWPPDAGSIVVTPARR